MPGNSLNWRLLSGSHDFPGPEGDTCLNEAAIVAAGLEYRAVKCAENCPPCFSQVIAGYALHLNNSMSDGLRQELLMPFVTRLAGTADTPEKEVERVRYIAIQTIKRILPISLRSAGLEEHARRCEQVDDLNAAAEVAAAAGSAARPDTATAATYSVDAAAAAARARDAANANRYADAAAHAAGAVSHAINAARYADASAPAASRQIFAIATAILDGAIKLGHQAEPIETALVVRRMDAIKEKARASA